MHKRHYLALALIALPVLAQAGDSRVEIGTGLASYYGAELSGNRTASGERFDPKCDDGGAPDVIFWHPGGGHQSGQWSGSYRTR